MMYLVSQIEDKLHAFLQDDVALKVADSVANKTTITGGGLTIFGGLAMNEWAILVGVVLGVAGFFADIWFKRRRLMLLEQQLKKRGMIDEDE